MGTWIGFPFPHPCIGWVGKAGGWERTRKVPKREEWEWREALWILGYSE